MQVMSVSRDGIFGITALKCVIETQPAAGLGSPVLWDLIDSPDLWPPSPPLGALNGAGGNPADVA